MILFHSQVLLLARGRDRLETALPFTSKLVASNLLLARGRDRLETVEATFSTFIPVDSPTR